MSMAAHIETFDDFVLTFFETDILNWYFSPNMTPEQREQRYQAFLHELHRAWTCLL